MDELTEGEPVGVVEFGLVSSMVGGDGRAEVGRGLREESMRLAVWRGLRARR